MMVAIEWRPFQLHIMKKSVITPTGVKLVRIPMLPIKWVHHLPDGSAVATISLARLLSIHLKNN